MKRLENEIKEKINLLKKGMREDVVQEDEHVAVLQNCMSKAWREATAREKLKGKGNSKVITNKLKIQEMWKREVSHNQLNINMRFDEWLVDFCKREMFGMSFGCWQKFVNTTFKYMACFKHLFPDIEFVLCHCPVDAANAKALFKIIKDSDMEEKILVQKLAANDKDYNWSNITVEDYQTFQSVVKFVCENKHITPLQFDILYR